MSFSTRRAIRQPPPNTRLISLDHGLQSVSPYSLNYGLQVRTIMASKCISKLARSRPPGVSPTSLDYGIEVHLQTRVITILECISKFSRSRHPSVSPDTLDCCLQVRLVTASKCVSTSAKCILVSGSLQKCLRGCGV